MMKNGKITPTSLFSLTQFLPTFPRALKSPSLLEKKCKVAGGEKDASLDEVFPCVFTELQMHMGNMEQWLTGGSILKDGDHGYCVLFVLRLDNSSRELSFAVLVCQCCLSSSSCFWHVDGGGWKWVNCQTLTCLWLQGPLIEDTSSYYSALALWFFIQLMELSCYWDPH